MESDTGIEMGRGVSGWRRWMSVALVFLLGVGLVLTGSAAYRMWSGAPDGYPHQQLRQLSGGINQVLLAGTLLAHHHGRKQLGGILLTLAVGTVAWSLVMM